MELGEKEESSESKSFKSDTDQKRDTPRWEKKLTLWKKYQGDEHTCTPPALCGDLKLAPLNIIVWATVT